MILINWPNIDWELLRIERQNKVISYMKENNLDAIILFSSDNIRYALDVQTLLTPETFSDQHAALITIDGKAHMITNFFADTMKDQYPWIATANKIPAWTPVSCQINNWVLTIQHLLSLENLEKSSIGIDTIPFDLYNKLTESLPGLNIKACMHELLEIRAIKTSRELSLLEEAACICDSAVNKAFNLIEPGLSEHELVGIIIGELARCGAEGLTHYPTVRTGKRTVEGAFPSSKKIGFNETVIFDIGVFGIGGYTCDMARTFITGSPSVELRNCYNTLLQIHLKSIEMLKPGTKASMIDDFINRSLNDKGLPASQYANGHGCGLRLMELPTIDSKENLAHDMTIEEGMVICIEPITYCSDGAVKLEDVIYVTSNGIKKLTRSPYVEV